MFELSLKEYLKHKSNSDIILDLSLIGFQELLAKDRGIKNFSEEWHGSQPNTYTSVARLLGNRLIERSNILKERDEEKQIIKYRLKIKNLL